MKNSCDIVAEAVRDFWKNKNQHTEPVIAFFNQKYDFETEWEQCAVFVDCKSDADFETVIFETDFCEGENCVKDLVVVPFYEVAEYYYNNEIKKVFSNEQKHKINMEKH